jgi:ParB family transcriptional regulator, chromosome partitioning protein
MSEKRKALGRGLSALLKEPGPDGTTGLNKVASMNGRIAMIPIDKIEVNPYQPRTHFDADALEELASSIRELGIVQPITVRKSETGYQIISGERRTRASKLAGLEEIPAYIRTANDTEMLEMALVENIQRQDLDPIEVALSYKRLIEECDLTQEKLSDRVGKKRSTVTNYLRLLKLPPLIQAGLRDHMISMGHARSLVNLPEEQDQLRFYKETIAKDWSVRDVELAVKNFKEKPSVLEPLDEETKATEKKPLPLAYQKLQEQLKSHYDTGVNIALTNKGKGKIVIPFNSPKDLERIVQIMNQKN